MPGDAITILHISDPQFGIHHVFGKRALPIADGKHDTLLARTIEDLTRLREKWGLKPDIIVLTGDLAEWGKKEEFKHCCAFLAGIATHLGIPPEQYHRIALIPGNHDINRNLAEAEYAEWRDSRKGEPFGFRRIKHYADAFVKFYARVPDGVRPQFTKKQPYSTFLVPEMHVVIAGLNSTMAECHLETADAKKQLGENTIYGHHGWCGEHQYQHFARDLAKYEADGWLRIGLVHHNIIRGSTTDDENLRDADDLKKHLGSVLNILLHGHTHVADRALLPQGQPVLSTGSASLTQAQRPDETPNQYQLLRIASNGVEAWMRSFDHHSRRWIPDARVGGEDTPGRLTIPHAFVSVSAALSSAKAHMPTAAPATEKGDEPTARRKTFLEREQRETAHPTALAHIAELRWPGAKLAWHRTEPPYLCVVTNEDFGFRSFVIGLLEAPELLGEEIDQFDKLTSMSTRWERSLVALMADRLESTVWQDLRDQASQRGIRLLSWREFERMCDLRISVEKQKEELQASKEYPPALYIPQSMEFFPRPTLGQSANEVEPEPAIENGFSELTKRIESGGPNFFLIDGDFGAGKTFLLRQLALHYSRDGAPVIPLLIELRSLDKVQNASDMLITRLGRLGQPEIRPAQLSYMAEAGHLLILFDGYDELALRVNFDRAADHLSTITEAAKGKASVVLTCRTQHFKDDHQMVVRLLEQAGLCRARLLPFSQQQILAFLEKKLGSAEDARERFELIQDIQDLLGLSENPRMLSFIADLPQADLCEAQQVSESGKITAARLYETIIDRWLRNEVRRHSHLQHKDAASGISQPPTSRSDEKYLAELWEAVTHLAFQAWGRMERPFELEEIQQTLTSLPKELLDTTLDEEQRTHGITSGSLLSREGAGAFAFAHYSIAEFLVARDLARQLRPQAQLPSVFPQGDAMKCFAQEVISDLMAEFLVDTLGWTAAVELGAELRQRRDEVTWGPYDRRNVMQLLAVCQKRLIKGAEQVMQSFWQKMMAAREPENLTGADLRGRIFDGDCSEYILSGADLTQASLRACIFSSAHFENARLTEADLFRCDLYGAVFTGANLTSANLSYADLRRADLTNANLTRATLIGADLRGAVLTGSQWEFARLAGATLDDPQLDGLGAFGAGLPALAHPPALLPGASSVNCVAWSPTHDIVASGHQNGCITLWDAHTGKKIHTLEGHSDYVRSVAFAGDGSRLASGSDDNTVRIWDSHTGKKIHTLEGHSGSVRSVAFAGVSRLASGSEDNTVRIWDSHTGKKIHTLKGHSNFVMSVAFAGDGSRLASGSEDNTVRIWDSHTGKKIHTLKGHSNFVTSVAFAKDGRRLASGSSDNTVCIWDAQTGKKIHTFKGRHRYLSSVAFTKDGSRLASASDDNTVRIWDAQTGKKIHTFKGHDDSICCVAFTEDGNRVASGSADDTIRIWDAHSGKTLYTFNVHSNPVRSMAFIQDGRLACGADDNTLRIWDVHSGKALYVSKGPSGSVSSIALAPNGSCLACSSDAGNLRMWDADSGEVLHALKGHSDSVWSVAFTKDGRRLASGSADNTLRIWEVHSGTLLHILKGHSDSIWATAFAADGSRLASGSFDHTVRVWDAYSGRDLLTLNGHSGPVLSVDFNKGGDRLASSSFDNTVRIWDADTGKALYSLEGHSDSVLAVAFDGDTSRIASGSADTTARIWDVDSGKVIHTLQGHSGSVLKVTFWQGRADGSRLLLSCSVDGTVRIWDTDSGQCLGILLAHGDSWAALRPDGRYRVVGDMRDYLWHVSGLIRYELGELDSVFPDLKLAEDEPLIPSAYFER